MKKVIAIFVFASSVAHADIQSDIVGFWENCHPQSAETATYTSIDFRADNTHTAVVKVFFNVNCSGEPVDMQTYQGTQKIGAASQVVAGAYDIDLLVDANYGETMYNIVKIADDKLWLGADSSYIPSERSTQLSDSYLIRRK